MSFTLACKEAIWIQKLIKEFEHKWQKLVV